MKKPGFASKEIELVDFRINEMRCGKLYEGIYGINVAKVREIVRMPENIVELPASPDYVVGAFDLRGTVIPLIDLAKWIGLETEVKIKESSKSVIISEFSNTTLGFIIHEAKLIRRINWNDIEPATFSLNSKDIERDKITATARVDNDAILLILDLESVKNDLDLYNDEGVGGSSPVGAGQFKGNVLVADDSAIARKAVRELLERMGFKVSEASNGQSAIDLLRSMYDDNDGNVAGHIDLIISDIEMPKIDGFHFVEYLKNHDRFKQIPVIFSSSICDKYNAQKGHDMGADAYLIKFDERSFLEKITEIFESKRSAN